MPELELINPHPTVPLSGAVRVGNTLYVSGQVGFRPGTQEIVPGGVAALGAVVAAAAVTAETGRTRGLKAQHHRLPGRDAPSRTHQCGF